MQAVRSLIWTVIWPFVVIVQAGRSSFVALLMGVLATLLGIGIALIIPKGWQLTYGIAVYFIGALLFWPIVNSKENHLTSVLVNLVFCGLLAGSALVYLYRFF